MAQYEVFTSAFTAAQMESAFSNGTVRINDTTKHWEKYDINSGNWIDLGILAEGQDYTITEDDYEEIAAKVPIILDLKEDSSGTKGIYLNDTKLTFTQLSNYVKDRDCVLRTSEPLLGMEEYYKPVLVYSGAVRFSRLLGGRDKRVDVSSSGTVTTSEYTIETTDNRSSTIDNSTSKYPNNKAVKTYVDAEASARQGAISELEARIKAIEDKLI